MPEAKFVLKEPNSTEPTLVYLFFYFGGQQLKYSTGQKIKPKFWNSNSQSAKETVQFPEYVEFNSLLDKLSTRVRKDYKTLILNGVKPTPDKLREGLNEELFRKEVSNPKSFLNFIEDLIKNSNKKASTIKQYKTTKKRLLDFSGYTRKEIEFDSIDLSFYDSFVKYLTTQKGYGINTIGATIKNIKAFMNEALERGLTNNVAFKSRKFKKLTEQSENIYLTEKEIEKLYLLDLKQNPRLDQVRDLFIIGCYTGLRFSDLSQLKKDNLIDKETKLKVKTEKTNELVIIPLHGFIKKILKKHKGELPKVISNQKMNEYLKELGEKAKIEESVLISATKAGKIQNSTYKKFELISSHTARRSFATNAYLSSVPTLSIMKITGHKTEKAFLSYIKMSQEDNANKLMNHSFFK